MVAVSASANCTCRFISDVRAGALWATQYTGGVASSVGMSELARDSWVHVHVEAARLFVDDVNFMSKVTSGDDADPFIESFGGAGCLKGRVAQIAFWDRHLQPSEAARISVGARRETGVATEAGAKLCYL